MTGCHACCSKPCRCAKVNGPRIPYEDCEHDYLAHEDAGEYVCDLCGDRKPFPLDRLIM